MQACSDMLQDPLLSTQYWEFVTVFGTANIFLIFNKIFLEVFSSIFILNISSTFGKSSSLL